MATSCIHQTIHGYLDGHRLLSSSTSLSSDAARTMLVLSDMSGPSMHPGFDEYLTGYPLPGTEFFVLARTWYAPEMPRPGCVWTHSLLIPKSQIAKIPTAKLLSAFRRPTGESVESEAKDPIDVNAITFGSELSEGFATSTIAPSIIAAVLGQPRPVIVVAETASQFEPAFLHLWEILWPSEKARFSFCTGALMPRSSSGILLDVQAVPRTIPPSQLRKSANTALVLDLNKAAKSEAWVDIVLEGVVGSDGMFRTWLESALSGSDGRSVVSVIAPFYAEWKAPGVSAQSMIKSVLSKKELTPGIQNRLIDMVFDRAEGESGSAGRREILEFVSRLDENENSSTTEVFLVQTRQLFDESRTEGVVLVKKLLGSHLSGIGESILRTAVLGLKPFDLESFDDAQAPYLPAIVGANQLLASSPLLWKRVGSRGSEILSVLASTELLEETRAEILDAIITSGQDFSAEALIRFGGTPALFRALSAIAAGQLSLTWQWRSALGSQLNVILEWLESLSAPSQKELELGTRFLSPKATQSRLLLVWKAAANCGVDPIPSRVAAFGLALAFWEGDIASSLFTDYFQPTYDAAGNSRLEYDEWDWLREWAPPKSYWREWDRCERLAKAIARLLKKQDATVETMFRIVRSSVGVRKVVSVMEDEFEYRQYLKGLRKVVQVSSIGTHEQQEALLAH